MAERSSRAPGQDNLRIGIDGRALAGRFTGDRTYWRNLIRALPELDRNVHYLIYSRTEIPPEELPDAPNLTPRVVPSSNDRVWTISTLPGALRRDGASLVHVQYTTPLLCPCPVVTTVHDISFRLFPQWFPARHRLLLNLTVPSSMRRAARVITDSQGSLNDILRIYRLPARKLASIYLAPGPEFAAHREAVGPSGQETAREIAKERYGIDGPFVLAVGVLQPRKNLIVLAEAFGLACARRSLPHRLVLVGKAGWGTEQERLRQAAAHHGGSEAAGTVLFPGYVPDADLPWLYQACDAFAYPSLYEGFGLPPLEAMACGAPVLVSDASPMPEIAGEAALIVGATDVPGWADALIRVLTEPELSADLRSRGPSRSETFSWRETALQTLEVYKQAAENRQ